jgi:hypothetical protein
MGGGFKLPDFAAQLLFRRTLREQLELFLKTFLFRRYPIFECMYYGTSPLHGRSPFRKRKGGSATGVLSHR